MQVADGPADSPTLLLQRSASLPTPAGAVNFAGFGPQLGS
jgi:hypothetical protein